MRYQTNLEALPLSLILAHGALSAHDRYPDGDRKQKQPTGLYRVGKLTTRGRSPVGMDMSKYPYTVDDCAHWAMKHGKDVCTGVVLDSALGIVCFDLDASKLPEGHPDRALMEQMVKEAREFGYAEYSLSGESMHLFVPGTIQFACRAGEFEIYNHVRFICLTGDAIYGSKAPLTPTEESQAFIDRWYALIEARKAGTKKAAASGVDFDVPDLSEMRIEMNADDNAVMMQVAMRHPDKFMGMYLKGHEAYKGENFKSEADMSFCRMVSDVTQDAQQIARIFMSSKLGEREKVQSRRDYVAMTIARVLATTLDKAPVKRESPAETAKRATEAAEKALAEDMGVPAVRNMLVEHFGEAVADQILPVEAVSGAPEAMDEAEGTNTPAQPENAPEAPFAGAAFAVERVPGEDDEEWIVPGSETIDYDSAPDPWEGVDYGQLPPPEVVNPAPVYDDAIDIVIGKPAEEKPVQKPESKPAQAEEMSLGERYFGRFPDSINGVDIIPMIVTEVEGEPLDVVDFSQPFPIAPFDPPPYVHVTKEMMDEGVPLAWNLAPPDTGKPPRREVVDRGIALTDHDIEVALRFRDSTHYADILAVIEERQARNRANEFEEVFPPWKISMLRGEMNDALVRGVMAPQAGDILLYQAKTTTIIWDELDGLMPTPDPAPKAPPPPPEDDLPPWADDYQEPEEVAAPAPAETDPRNAFPVIDIDKVEDPGPPPGLAGQWVTAMSKKTNRAQISYTSAAFVSSVAAMAARSYSSAMSGSLNVYFGIVGNSGTGKSAVPDTINQVVQTINKARIQYFDSGIPFKRTRANSLRGALNAAIGTPSCLLAYDEVAQEFMKSANAEPGTNQNSLTEFLKIAFDGGHKGENMSLSYAKKEDSIKFERAHAVSFIGEMDEKALRETFGGRYISSDGSLARMTIIVERRDAIRHEAEAFRNTPLPSQGNERIAQLMRMWQQDNTPEPGEIRPVGIAPDARRLFGDIKMQVENMMNMTNKSIVRDFANRIYMRIDRIASNLSVFENPDNPIISVQQMMWAAKFVMHHFNKIRFMIVESAFDISMRREMRLMHDIQAIMLGGEIADSLKKKDTQNIRMTSSICEFDVSLLISDQELFSSKHERLTRVVQNIMNDFLRKGMFSKPAGGGSRAYFGITKYMKLTLPPWADKFCKDYRARDLDARGFTFNGRLASSMAVCPTAELGDE